MRKTILALAIPAATVMASAHAATVYNSDNTTFDVYGRIEADMTNAGGNGSATGTDTQGALDTSSRLGLKGTTKLNEDVTLFGKAEWQVAGENSDGTKFDTRYMYLGADFGKGGKVSFGQQYLPIYTSLVSTVDIFDQWGMEAQNGIYGESREASSVVYSNTFGALTVQGGYQFHNEDANDVAGITSTEVQSNGYSAAAVYDTGIGLNLRAAYAYQDFEDSSKTNIFGAGADYSIGNTYLAFVYLGSRAKDASAGDTDIDSYDLVGAYTIDQYRLYTGYGLQHRSGDAVSDNYNAVSSYKLGVEYNFTPNTLAWVEYRHNNGDVDQDGNFDDSTNTYGKNEVALSAQYNF